MFHVKLRTSIPNELAQLITLEKTYKMKKLGLLAILHAKPEQAKTVSDFIRGAIDLAKKEEKTLTWYSFQMDETTFGIFDTFEDESGREAHLNGEIAKALMGKADELLTQAPDIKKIDILSAK